MEEPFISVSEAREKIFSVIKSVGGEIIRTSEAEGRTLAAPVEARIDIPPFDNSAMDGFAVRMSDLTDASKENPVRLKVIDEVPAGRMPEKEVQKGTAISIMTGAPIPPGADAVVPVEETERKDGEAVFISRPQKYNIRNAGEVAKAGAVVLDKGIRVGPPEMGMLATVGVTEVRVSRRPRIAVVSTGDELAEPGRPLPPGMIYASNAAAVVELVRRYGGEPVDLGIARDTEEEIHSKICAGLGQADAVITSGGVSVGEFDHVKKVMAKLDAGPRFWRVRMRPGQPLAFAVSDGKPIFGLPGNPVAVMVSFFQFVRSAMLKMQERSSFTIPTVTVILDEPVKARPNFTSFIRARLVHRAGEFHATRTGPQGSAIVGSMVVADALLVIGEEKTDFAAGERVPAQILDFAPPSWPTL